MQMEMYTYFRICVQKCQYVKFLGSTFKTIERLLKVKPVCSNRDLNVVMTYGWGLFKFKEVPKVENEVSVS